MHARTVGALALTWAFSCWGANAGTVRTAPKAGCLDAQTISAARLVAPREVLVRTNADGQGTIHLLTDCPLPPEGDEVGALAPDGWLCAGGGAWVRSGDALCPVIAWQPMSPREFSDALGRHAVRPDLPSLDPVEVRGRSERGRGFVGTTESCLDSRHLRGWHVDADGLVAEVSPMRHAGNRYYRIETAQSCSHADMAEELRLESGVGITAICGRPGDRVVLGNARARPGVDMMQSAIFERGLAGRRCDISRVYPLRDR